MKVLDLTECNVLPPWSAATDRRIFPIRKGKYWKDYDLAEELLPPDELKALQDITEQMLQKEMERADRFYEPGSASHMPIGFDVARLPSGARIRSMKWPVQRGALT